MRRSDVTKHIDELLEMLQKFRTGGAEMVAQLANKVVDCLKDNKKILIFGNGGSAADSQHMAAEIVGKFAKERQGLPAFALTADTSVLTAIGNDYGYDQIFSKQIGAIGREGDLAIGLSTSGKSKNVIAGIRKAKVMGMSTAAITGGSNLIVECDHAIILPQGSVAHCQECTIAVIHLLCQAIDDHFAK